MIDIQIDALTNSIRQRQSGEVFENQIVAITEPLPVLQGWQFDWHQESKQHPIYQLTTVEDPNTIQGLISLEKLRGYVLGTLKQ
jgi:hypothetical protein